MENLLMKGDKVSVVTNFKTVKGVYAYQSIQSGMYYIKLDTNILFSTMYKNSITKL
jgi:hypothetical protein